MCDTIALSRTFGWSAIWVWSLVCHIGGGVLLVADSNGDDIALALGSDGCAPVISINYGEQMRAVRDDKGGVCAKLGRLTSYRIFDVLLGRLAGNVHKYFAETLMWLAR